jgi:tetratricopeptide (TPR) repeat protein/tRNA A-37 threonylcarbamoyl transferase component Bud32
MAKQYTCPRGHRWEASSDPAPAGAGTVLCPVCGGTDVWATMPPPESGPAAGPSAPLAVQETLADLKGTDEPHTVPPALADLPGYEVLAELGRGAMGAVFKARQVKLNRLVALKMILGGDLASANGLARFRAEGEAVARLRHPNIVQVYDSGEQAGVPFFSMEFVAGGSLADQLRGTPMPPRPAAALAEILARAVQAAHGQGIVHRDLKPANILLDTDGTPKIADFGLAKQLGSSSGQTASGAVMGTPSYMAPEQAAGRTRDVGPAADVYALGAILYDLLTGRPPFRAASVMETLMQVMHEEPVAIRRLQPGVPRDLETICHKAMARDARRRYATARELSEDLQRFAKDEPIQARRSGRLERLGRWCRRNPAVAGLSAAVLVFMAVGTAVSTWQAVVATRARNDLAGKNAELKAEQAKVEARNEELARQKKEVEARFATAQKAIATFHTGVSEDFLLKNEEFKELRTKLLKEAAGFYSELEKLLAGKTDAKSRKLLADGYFQLGELTGKVGDQGEALAVQRKALAVRRELAAAPGADVETRLDVARSLRAVGNLLRTTGDTPGMLSAFQEQRDLAAALEAESPTDAVRTLLAYGHHSIGRVLSQTGKPAEALREYQKARAIFQQLADANPAVTDVQSGLAHSRNNIGNLLRKTGKPAEALQEHQKARAIRQKLADANPAVTAFQLDLALSHNNIAFAVAEMGKPAEALQEYHKALAIRQKLADANRAVTAFQSDLAASHKNIAVVLAETGKPAEALQEYHKALAIQQKLADARPADTEFQSDLAASHNNIAIVLSETGKPAEALQEHQKALAIRQQLADGNPAVTAFQSDLASSYNNIGLVLHETGKPAEALQEYHKALAIQQQLADANPAVTDFQRDLARSHTNIGALLTDHLRKHAEALQEHQKALAIQQKLADANPAVTDFQRDLARSHANVATVLSRTGKPAEALQEHQKALAIRQKVADGNPAVTPFQSDLATSHNHIGQLHAREKRFSEAFAALDRGLAIRQKLADAHPTSTQYINHLGYSHAYRGWAHVRAGHPAQAAADLRRALALWEKEKSADSETRFERGRALALLAGLAADGKSGVTAAEAAAFADQAALALHDALRSGWGRWAELKEPDFDALRKQADFQKLLAQLQGIGM